MSYLFKNIDNPWVIAFFLLFFISISHIIWFFFIILKKVELPYEEWKKEIEKDVEFTYDLEVLEHMHMVCLNEYNEEKSKQAVIQRRTSRFMIFAGILFVIIVAALPYTLKYFPYIKIPNIKNPLFLMYELYIITLILFTLSFFLCYKSFYKAKFEESEGITIPEKGSEYQVYLKKGILDLALDTRARLISNERRTVFLLRAKVFGYIGLFFFTLTVALSFLSKYLWQ